MVCCFNIICHILLIPIQQIRKEWTERNVKPLKLCLRYTVCLFAMSKMPIFLYMYVKNIFHFLNVMCYCTNSLRLSFYHYSGGRQNTFSGAEESSLINNPGLAGVWVRCGCLRSWNTHTERLHAQTHRLKSSFFSRQDDEVVLQCVACIQKENRKFCLAAEGLGNRLCYLEPTSEAKVCTNP